VSLRTEAWSAETKFKVARRVGRASAGVPVLWYGTDVLIDPGDEHGGIVSFGTFGDVPADQIRGCLILGGIITSAGPHKPS
jgi:hypothetical protein